MGIRAKIVGLVGIAVIAASIGLGSGVAPTEAAPAGYSCSIEEYHDWFYSAPSFPRTQAEFDEWANHECSTIR